MSSALLHEEERQRLARSEAVEELSPIGPRIQTTSETLRRAKRRHFTGIGGALLREFPAQDRFLKLIDALVHNNRKTAAANGVRAGRRRLRTRVAAGRERKLTGVADEKGLCPLHSILGPRWLTR